MICWVKRSWHWDVLQRRQTLRSGWSVPRTIIINMSQRWKLYYLMTHSTLWPVEWHWAETVADKSPLIKELIIKLATSHHIHINVVFWKVTLVQRKTDSVKQPSLDPVKVKEQLTAKWQKMIIMIWSNHQGDIWTGALVSTSGFELNLRPESASLWADLVKDTILQDKRHCLQRDVYGFVWTAVREKSKILEAADETTLINVYLPVKRHRFNRQWAEWSHSIARLRYWGWTECLADLAASYTCRPRKKKKKLTRVETRLNCSTQESHRNLSACNLTTLHISGICMSVAGGEMKLHVIWTQNQINLCLQAAEKGAVHMFWRQ